MNKNHNKTYITWFLILILPPILIRIGTASGQIVLSEDLAGILTIISKLGAIALTVWYALKVNIKSVWAWIMGFSTLLPFMVWISLIILLTRKDKVDSRPITTSEIPLTTPEVKKKFNLAESWNFAIGFLLIFTVIGSVIGNLGGESGWDVIVGLFGGLFVGFFGLIFAYIIHTLAIDKKKDVGN